MNVTGLLRRLQVKIENIYLFKILIKKHENVFKSCPKFGGAAAPLAPPARTPMSARIVGLTSSLMIVQVNPHVSDQDHQ